jgi:hypothetical protein
MVWVIYLIWFGVMFGSCDIGLMVTIQIVMDAHFYKKSYSICRAVKIAYLVVNGSA